MPKTVEVPDDVYASLEDLGGRLFTISEVIRRLVEAQATSPHARTHDSPQLATVPQPQAATKLGILGMRAPRERGATVEVAGQRIHASTVGDLYSQVFRVILSNGKADELKALAPYRTSNQRYLFAREPKHPNGNDFVVPVKVGSLHVEAHKNYEQAIKQLATLLSRLGVSFSYLG